MDTDKLITHSRARFDHASAKRTLKEKYKGRLVFAYNGGMFCAGAELISTLLACPGTTAVILDLYDNPIKVTTAELHSKAQVLWQESMEAWFVEYTELNKNR